MSIPANLVRRWLPAVGLAVLLAAPAPSQPAGVDVVLHGGGQTLGAPCTPFSTGVFGGTVFSGLPYRLEAYAAPYTVAAVLFGSGPTTIITTIPGIGNALLVHDPVFVLLIGITGAPDPASSCGQGSLQQQFVMPTAGFGWDYTAQTVGWSSLNDELTFSRPMLITFG